MSFFKNAACWLGLVDQGWVRVKGPDIDVVITGDRDRVHQVMVVVQEELVRLMRESGQRPARSKSKDISAVVPTEFDERDSPYVVSGRVLHRRPGRRSDPKRGLVSPGFARRVSGLGARGLARDSMISDAETEQVGPVVLLEITEQ